MVLLQITPDDAEDVHCRIQNGLSQKHSCFCGGAGGADAGFDGSMQAIEPDNGIERMVFPQWVDVRARRTLESPEVETQDPP